MEANLTLAAKISSRLLDARKLGLSFALRDVSRLRNGVHECRVRGIGRVAVRLGGTDAPVFQQVFRDRQYDISTLPQHARILDAYAAILKSGRRPLIIDCGANNGASALWFALQYPDATIVAVEPDPGNIAMCRRNTRGHGRIEVLPAAIGAEPGTVRVEARGEEEAAFQTVRDPAGDTLVVTVAGIASDHPDHDLFIVKVDIEGFEADLFSRNTEWLDEAAATYIEPHDWMLPGQGTSRGFQSLAASRNFEVLISGENLVYVR